MTQCFPHFLLFLLFLCSSHSAPSLRERLAGFLNRSGQDFPVAEGTLNTPGTYRFEVKHQGKTRPYLLHLPKGWQQDRKLPVILALHGGGGHMEYMARDELYGLISKSDESGFAVVFPNGFSRFPGGKLATWNAGKCCGGSRDENSDDVGYIRRILKDLPRHFTVDSSRIFAIGMSNGGMMSYRLACEMSGVFKGIASVTGTDNTLVCKPQTPVSILHIHAKNDDHVLFEGGMGDAVRNPAKVNDFTSVPQTVSMWLEHNQCTPESRRVLQNKGAYCDVHETCQNQSRVKLCVTKEGGHSWPGGFKPAGRSSESTSKALHANDVIWDFFQSLPQAKTQPIPER